MALVDIPLERLKAYKPAKNKQDDFDAFGEEKIHLLRAKQIEYDI